MSTTEEQINNYIASHPEPKRTEIQELHDLILHTSPAVKLWYEDGKNEEGKIISNPVIGYGAYTIQYASGKTKDFFPVGLSVNTKGISVYILGIKDKTYLSQTYGARLGKASITGYCIKFKTLKDIDTKVLEEIINYGLDTARTSLESH